MSEFCTVINCIDGRVQLPVNNYARVKFLARYVDTITEPGAVRYFDDPKSDQMSSILSRLEIALAAHGSRGIAIVAHADCAGNPVPDETQQEQIKRAVDLLTGSYPGREIIGLWVNEMGYCHEVVTSSQTD